MQIDLKNIDKKNDKVKSIYAGNKKESLPTLFFLVMHDLLFYVLLPFQ